MEPERLRILSCPNGCRFEEIVVLPLPQRPLLLCYCKGCHAVWYEGSGGPVAFSRKEMDQLRRLRARYLRGELLR